MGWLIAAYKPLAAAAQVMHTRHPCIQSSLMLISIFATLKMRVFDFVLDTWGPSLMNE